MKKSCLLFAAIGLALGCQGGGEKTETAATKPEEKPAATAPAAGGATFASVQGILTQNCIGCHGVNGKEGINLTSFETVMKGGEHGAIVKPGDASNSLLIHALRGSNGAKQMPLKGPLPEAEIKAIEDWINAGAKQS